MYRPPMDPSQFKSQRKTRTSCPSCGAAITPEQDAQIIERDRQRDESISEKIKVARMSPEEQVQYFEDRKGEFSERTQKGLGQQSPEVQEIEAYLRDSTKTGTLHSEEAGIRQRGIDLKAKYGGDLQGYLDRIKGQSKRLESPSILPILPDGGYKPQPGLPGQQRPFPVEGLWDRKQEDENRLTPPPLGTPGSPEAEARLKWEKENNWNPSRSFFPVRPQQPIKGLTPNFDDMTAGSYPIHGDENSWGLGSEETMKKKYPTGFPTNDLFRRKQQEIGFYQGPSAAEQKKGAIWGVPKKPRLGQSQKLPNFGATGNQGNSYMRDRRKSIQGVMGKMY